jgi:hypothetical protein
MGFIDYNGRIHVHRSLLNVVLHDHSQAEDDEARTRPVSEFS